MTANKSVYQNFVSTLVASGRSPEIPESADVNGWLVGSWELDVLHYKTVELSSRNIKGEVHFCWVLEGRAIQDVWIMPRLADRQAQGDRTNNMYGTTLRYGIPQYQPGGFAGPIPLAAMRNVRLDEELTLKLYKSARDSMARQHAGGTLKSPQIHSAG